jgi:YD repeat-containing protein
MKNIYFTCLLTLSVLFISNKLIAQGLNVESFETYKAPQTRDLGAVAFTPVSMFTGQPSISIPIYTVNHFGLQIPISLSYDASGFVPDKAPGVVGLNWSLNAGGMITRNVNNVPDESDDGGSYNSGAVQGKSHGFFYGPRNNTNAFVSNVTNIMQNNFYKYYYELSPDLFLFNFCGHTGKFMMGQDGAIKVESDEDFIVDVTSLQTFVVGSLNPSTYQGKITLTDTKGLKYEFGGSRASTEFSSPGTTFANGAPNAWYLVRITTPEGNAVNFNYASETELLRPNSNLTAITTKSGSSQLVENVYLRSIECLNNLNVMTQRIDLVNGEKTSSFSSYVNEQLNNLIVKDKDLNVKKNVNFTYATYPFGINGGKSRTLLTSVGEIGLSPHTFEYYNTNQLSDVEQAGDKTDYWGYYNNKTKLSPPPTPTYDTRMNMIDTLDRWEPDIKFAKTGILSVINDPLKGKTVYEYEARSYDHDYQLHPTLGWSLASTSGLGPNGGTPIAGGLRLAKISLIDGTTEMTREYKYTNDYSPNGTVHSSSGIITRRPALFKYNLITLPEAASLSEPSVYYSEVVENTIGNGYTIYKFTSGNYPDISVKSVSGTSPYYMVPAGPGTLNFSENDIINFYNKRSIASLERGKPESVIVYNNSGVPISGTQYTYNTSPDRYDQKVTTVIFPVIGVNPKDFLGRGINGIVSTYDTYFFSTKLKKEVYSQYNGSLSNISLSATSSYNYNGKNQLSEKITTKSDGKINTRVITYPNDYPAGVAFIDDMKMAGLSGLPIEEVNYQSDGTNVSILSGQVTQYYTGGKGRPELMYKLQTNAPVPLSGFKFSSRSAGTLPSSGSPVVYSPDGRYQPAMNFTHYDNFGNLLEKIPSFYWKGVPTSYRWGYNGQYPIAEIKNSKSNDVYTQNFEDLSGVDYDASSSIDATRKHTGTYSNVINNSASAEKVSYSSQYLNINSGTARMFTYSGWVYSTGPSTQLFLFMFRAGDNGNATYIDNVDNDQTGKWIYVTKNVMVPADVISMRLRLDNNSAGSVWFDDLAIRPADAQLNTYTYNPSVGITSKIDSNGQTTYYEYDQFQRLINVKDQNGLVKKYFQYNYKH